MEKTPLIIEYGTKIYRISKKDMKEYKAIIAKFEDDGELPACVEAIKKIAYKYKPIGDGVFSYFQVRDLLEKQMEAISEKIRMLPCMGDEQSIKIKKLMNNSKPIKFGLYEPSKQKKVQNYIASAN